MSAHTWDGRHGDSPSTGESLPHAGKFELIDRVREYARTRSEGGEKPAAVAELAGEYFRHVAAEDVLARSEEDLYGLLAAQLDLARVRVQGTAEVAVFTPERSAEGWSALGRTVVQVVTDDMPFLVDSVTMALEAEDDEVQLVVHPQFVCRRDLEGHLIGVLDERADTQAHDAGCESWMHVEVSRLPAEAVEGTRERLVKVLTDVRQAVEDWPRMHSRAEEIAAELEQGSPSSLPAEEVRQGSELLRWLADDHFTFLGYREYQLEARGSEEVLGGTPGTGYGILRSDPAQPVTLPGPVAGHARDKTLLVLTKANSVATVHRPVHLDYVGVKKFDDAGEVVGERRFLGLFSSAAYTESVTRIPILREKARTVLAESNFAPRSHSGKALMDVVESFPREDLFQTPTEDLAPLVAQVVHTRERRRLKLFVRRDVYGRFFSCLVYLPRERYNAAAGARIAAMLKAALTGESVEFTAHVGEAFAARLHVVVRPGPGSELADPDTADLERRCASLARSWRDDFVRATVAEHGEELGARLAHTYADALSEAYKEDYSAVVAAGDVARLNEVAQGGGPALALHTDERAGEDQLRLKVFRVGERLSLSQVLPLLSSMGVEVIDERLYELEGLDQETRIYDFGLRYHERPSEQVRACFTDTVQAAWEARNETDGFNALVLGADLDWRRATLLRAYAKYMRQGGTPFGQDYIEQALSRNPEITALLVDYFEERFDPDRHQSRGADPARQERCVHLEEQMLRQLEDVASLDQDRILRAYLGSIKATLRTNFYQVGVDGAPHPYIALKINPDEIDYLPQPRPRYEIFVYSPRVEGVHLRFGAVARGGLRWSDRRDDFRTEVLGLVKAQMVKNTVIVPVGSKGGFFPKMLPEAADRDAWLAEGKDCYRTFICGLLDLTDNIIEGLTVPPERVVRHDGDDTYLVVAADKGTATFSDIANEISKSYGYWLGDAFASGGSVGYDHKTMGITARGAWISVRRHFREMGIDCQNQDITCVGIGDMSGDVFGNGMLSSKHIRLVAAFDHRHIFIDPDPDAATSFGERRRLFELPRSSWKDYDTSLISRGGGVWPRSAKSIPLSAQAQQALGVEGASMTPARLMQAILLAPTDLLWNGGIGTYVKAAEESQADAGDKANDAIRVDGAQLRVRCVGEGGNLGFTQRGRIEYAQQGCAGRGGRNNTDFIDNSAGVDTSDHEVNIKILLDRLVAEGHLTTIARNNLLQTMTDEVADLVLADNYRQNVALAMSAAEAPRQALVHEDWMQRLEAAGALNREQENLPLTKELAARAESNHGLTQPELAVLLAYTKMYLADELLATGVPDEPWFQDLLISYFPEPLRTAWGDEIKTHPLRREIVVTRAVNDLVNGAGTTYFHRLSEETHASTSQLLLANFAAREIFDTRAVIERIDALDNLVPADVQTHMRAYMRDLVERAARWLVYNRPSQFDLASTVAAYSTATSRVLQALPELFVGHERKVFADRRETLTGSGVPDDLATRVAAMAPAYTVLTIGSVADRLGFDALEVARVHFAIGERMRLATLGERIHALPHGDRWHTMARVALREEIHAIHGRITAWLLATTNADDPVEKRIEMWESNHQAAVSQATGTIEEVCADDQAGLAALSVGVRMTGSLLDGISRHAC